MTSHDLVIKILLYLFEHTYLRQWPVLTGDICSESPPKVCEIDMAQGQDMSKGPGTEEIMFLSAFILEI